MIRPTLGSPWAHSAHLARVRGGIACLVATLGLALAPVTIGAAAKPGSGDRLPAPPKTQTVRLANGLQALLAPDPNATTADVAVWYRVGSAHEPPGQSGITHLVERMMFRSAADSAHDYRRLLTAEGAIANTMTTPDFTSFYASLPPEAVELAIGLEGRRMGGTELTEPSFATEHEFVQRERRGILAANPVGYAVERLFAAAYPEHGYGLPVLGTESDLAALTLERAREYQARHYRPGNALVTVTGRFDPKRVRAALGSAFERLPRDGTPAPVAVVPPPPRPRVEERLPGRFSMVLVGWRAPEVKRPLAGMELMASILGDPTSGRLARGLTGPERPFVQVRSGVDARQQAALLYVYALLAPGTDAAAAESALLDTINALTLQAVTETELADARARLELAARIDLQTSRGVARAIGTGALVDGDPTALWKRLNEARAMTPTALQQLARDLLTESRRSIVVLSGEAPPGSGSPP